MRCPFCGSEDTQVKDSRPVDDASAIRRRRQCPDCGARFTTFERVQLRDLLVVKKMAGGRRSIATSSRSPFASRPGSAASARSRSSASSTGSCVGSRPAAKPRSRRRGSANWPWRAWRSSTRLPMCGSRRSTETSRPCATSRNSSASCRKIMTPSRLPAPRRS